jgi:3-hydroxyisobutyrate dehydrogenase-like beta-hydroxyacid dehydrogenase
MKLTVLGLGEVGSLIAKGLADQGVEVMAFDSAKVKNPVVALADTAEAAVADADVVFSLNSAMISLSIAEQVAGSLKPGAVFCDLNTGTPSLKRRLAEIVPAGSFVDGALMHPLESAADRLVLSVSGPGAERFTQLFEGLNAEVTYVSEVAGEAAARELIRSMVAKGMAAVAIDVLWAAKELGLQDWAIQELKSEFDAASADSFQRQLDTTAKNPKRHSVELGNVVEMLSEAGYESTTLNGVAATLSKVMHSKKIPHANTED